MRVSQVTVILIGLCQAWIGVFSAVVYSGPTVALRYPHTIYIILTYYDQTYVYETHILITFIEWKLRSLSFNSIIPRMIKTDD